MRPSRFITHRRSRLLRLGSAATAAACVLVATSSPAVELRRAPYLQAQRPDGITIRWRTDDSSAGPAVVRFGTSMDRLDHAVEAKELHDHFPGIRDWQATIDGLKPNARYFYSVEVAQVTLAGADERHVFRTAPPRGKPAPLRFWLFGDSGSNRPRGGEAADVLKLKAPPAPITVRNGFRVYNKDRPLDGIILLGDNAYPRGIDSEWQVAFFGVYADELASVPLWPCVGNHDLDEAYKYIFTVPGDGAAGGVPSKSPLYYAFDIANVHVIVLDPWKSWWETTTDPAHPAWVKQKAWLEADLKANRADWTIVVNHFPLYCDGNYDSDGELLTLLRGELAELLEDHGADLSLVGHDHTYQRSYLIDGHYGTSDSFDPDRHIVGGVEDESAKYTKKHGPRGGIIHVVSGTGGGTRPKGDFAHPAMVPLAERDGKPVRGLAQPGSFLLEIDGLTLKGTQVGAAGEVLDQFTLTKTR